MKQSKKSRGVWGLLLTFLLLFTELGGFLPAATVEAADTENDYAAALALSLYFFDANACGTDAGSQGISWRGNCHTYDATAKITDAYEFPEAARSLVDPDGDGQFDASGGYHDAGDHVKFNLTMGFAGNSLALSEYLHPGIWETAGAKEHLLKIVKRNADYLMKTTYLDSNDAVVAICHVVGDGNVDHGDLNAPETQTYTRTTYWLEAGDNNAAVCCEMAAALGGAAYLYKDSNAAYAAECVKYAKALLAFAKANPGNSCPGLYTFYNTDAQYQDEMAMAEAWLWVLEEGSQPSWYPSNADGGYVGSSGTQYDGYLFCWDKVWQGYAAMMYKATGDAAYANELKYELNKAGGLSVGTYNMLQAHNVTWGVSRHNCGLQMDAIALANGDANSDYAKAAKYQMDYILGNNTYGYSFLIGYGSNWPTHIHHRAANPGLGTAQHTLNGALIGGPDKNGYQDDSNSYQYTEPALDYNGCFALACAGLAELYPAEGSTPAEHTHSYPASCSENESDYVSFIYGDPANDYAGTYVEVSCTSSSCDDKEGSVLSANAVITSETVEAGCTTAGAKYYHFSADLTSQGAGVYTAEKVVAGDAAKGHNWVFDESSVTWTGSDEAGYTAATAKKKCDCSWHNADKDGAAEQIINAVITVSSNGASCIHAGEVSYTATFTDDCLSEPKVYTQTVTGKTSTLHTFSNPPESVEFVWTGYEKAQASFTCDHGHSFTLDAVIKQQKEKTQTVYTATITLHYVASDTDGQELTKVYTDTKTEETSGEEQEEEEFVIDGVEEHVYYTGSKITFPSVQVYDPADPERPLVLNKDYKISYRNNINASTEESKARLVVKGIGNYTKEAVVEFSIEPREISTEEGFVIGDLSLRANGKAQKKAAKLYWNGKVVPVAKKGVTNFTLEYADTAEGAYTAPGSWNVKLKGQGNFTGEMSYRIVILDKADKTKVSAAKVKLKISKQAKALLQITDKNAGFSNEAAFLDAVSVTYGKQDVKAQFTLDVVPGNGAGISFLVVRAKDAGEQSGDVTFLGSKSQKIKIQGIKLSADLFTYNASVPYTAKAYTAESLGLGSSLIAGEDYTISYKNNTKAGKGKMILKGKGVYQGSLTLPFTISKGEAESFAVDYETTVSYKKDKAVPEVTVRSSAGMLLKEGTDYTLSFPDQKKGAGTQASFTIKGKGNFGGSVTKNYTITTAELEASVDSITADVLYTSAKETYGKYLLKKPTVYDKNSGKALKAGVDYEWDGNYYTQSGQQIDAQDAVIFGEGGIELWVYAKLTGKGNYTGENVLAPVQRIVLGEKLKAASITSGSIIKTYTGEAITLEASDFTAVEGVDFYIDQNSYRRNIRKGTASVTVYGRGKYAGKIMLQFKIVAKDIGSAQTE